MLEKRVGRLLNAATNATERRVAVVDVAAQAHRQGLTPTTIDRFPEGAEALIAIALTLVGQRSRIPTSIPAWDGAIDAALNSRKRRPPRARLLPKKRRELRKLPYAERLAQRLKGPRTEQLDKYLLKEMLRKEYEKQILHKRDEKYRERQERDEKQMMRKRDEKSQVTEH